MNPAISAIVRPLLSLMKVPSVTAALFFVSVALAFAAPESASQRREGKGAASVVNPAWRADQSVETSGAKAQKPPFAAGELLVKFKAGVVEEKKGRLHAKNGGKKLREFKRLRLHHVKLKQGDAVEEALARYQSDPDVEYAEPNYQFFKSSVPNDTSYSSLWGMAKINAPQAWDITTGSQEVVVAVIDSGIDYNHPDLAANMWVNPRETSGNGADDDNNGFVDDLHGINAIATVPRENAGDAMDDNGHGTHASGIIGAAGNNGIGVAGVNWSVKIMACKFLDANGSGYTSDAIACLEYVKAQKDAGVNVVATNNSYAGRGYSRSLYEAIKAQSDILFVAAAGNAWRSNDTVADYPSGYDLPNVISVAATTSSDVLSSWSNYGKNTVDVAAPGEDILSTLPAKNEFGLSGGYGTLSGSSMAAPHVTGLAALLKAQDPSRDYSKIRNLILSGGRDLASLSGKIRTGKIIDAAASLSCQNRPLFLVDWLPPTLALGHPYTISALSINCDAPAGPVTVTGDGVSMVLADPAGTGSFTGTWTPDHLPVTLTISSPAGSQTLSFSSLKVIPYVPSARVEIPYSRQLQAVGGVPPYVWSVKSGVQPDGKTSTLPSGLSWTSDGVISGTLPNSASNNTSGSGNSNTAQALFMVEVTDSLGEKSSSWVSLDIDGQGWVDQSFGEFYDGGAGDKAWGVATDAAGNSYVTGESYNGSDNDVILLKYSPSGTLLWKRTYDNGGDQIGRSVTLDQSGNLYVAGSSGMPGNHLLLKYDASGNLVWDRAWNGGGDDGAFGVAVDTAGSVFTVGNVQTGEGNQVLLSKYDAGGNAVWSRIHPGGAYGYSIAADNGGNLYFAGSLGSDRAQQMLLAKYDGEGNSVWTRTLTDTAGANSAFNGVAVDGSGNPYVTGWVQPEKYMYVSYGLTAKYDAAGNLLWSSRLKGRDGLNDNFSHNYPQGIAISNDKVYVAVEDHDRSHTNFLVVRYDTLGNKLWAKRLDANAAEDYSYAVAADGGGVTVAGYSGSKDALTGTDIVTARYAEVAPRYDLAVTSLSAQYSQGMVAYTVKMINNGAGSPTANLNLSFSADASPSSDDYVGNRILNISLPAGVEVTKTGTFTISSGPVSGNYYVTATIDPYNALNEVSKSNNSMVGARVDLSSDLIVSAAWGTLSKQAGMIDYTVKVKNAGKVTSAPSSTALYLSTDPSVTAGDYPIGVVQTPPVAAGTEATLTGTAAVSSTVPPGIYYLAATADAAGVVLESLEDNNSNVGSMVTMPADLTVTALSGSVSQGILNYSLTVRNKGWQTVAPSLALYFSPDAYTSADDRMIVQLTTGDIAGGSDVTLSGQAAVPPALPGGAYYLMAVADPDNYLAETDETNNSLSGGRFTIGSAATAIDYSRLGTGSGTVTFAPGGECSGDCSQGYDAGTTVTLTAAPALGSLFTGWGGACSGTATCTVTMNAGKQVTATFNKKPTVNYTKAGTGAGTITFYPGTSCAGNCAQSFDSGTSVTILATPSANARFVGWSGACAGTGACGVTMTGDKSVSATFEPVFPKISAGAEHTSMLTGNTVWGWGRNVNGALGDGTFVDRRTATQAWSSTGIASIAATSNGFTTIALKQDGSVVAWGANGYGAVGDGTYTDRSTPVTVSGLSQITAVTGGDDFSLALRGDGTVWTWGDNSYAQLANGLSGGSRATAAQVAGLTGVTGIGATWATAFAIKGDGTLWGWGYNYDGEIGDGTYLLRTTPVQVQGISGVTSVTGGWYHTLALKSDGTVWAWGDNLYGELGDGTATPRTTPAQVPGLSGVVAIAAGGYTSFALKDDGTIWAWGENDWGVFGNGGWDSDVHSTPVQVPGLSGVVAISAGDFHIVAVKGDGTIWTWGDNEYGQMADGTDIERDAPVQVMLDVNIPTTTASPSPGTYDTAQTVTLTPDEAATVYYTLNGSTPTTSSAVYTGPLSISSMTTLKFFAKDPAGNAEAVRTATYVIAPSSAPNVEFNANTVWGQPPLSVTFSDLSTGSATSWLWNFGDGTTSTTRNPVHSYSAYGSYTVTLTVTGPGGTASKTKVGFINVASTTNLGITPVSTATPAGGTYTSSQSVVLSRNISSTIYYTLDGSQPTTSSLVYSMPIAISNNTTLKYFARDSAGRTEAVNTQVYRIVPAGMPQADFAASTRSGSAALNVSFSDLSTGSPTSWLWSFGDGSTSTLRNPSHVYRTPGSYTVSLTVTGAGGTDTRGRTGYVVASDPGPDSLQPLYAGAEDGSVLFTRSGDLIENLLFDRDISVKIVGGYDFLYRNVVGVTKVHGLVRIKNGKVILENLSLR